MSCQVDDLQRFRINKSLDSKSLHVLHVTLYLEFELFFDTGFRVSAAKAFGVTEFLNPKDYKKPIQEVCLLVFNDVTILFLPSSHRSFRKRFGMVAII